MQLTRGQPYGGVIDYDSTQQATTGGNTFKASQFIDEFDNGAGSQGSAVLDFKVSNVQKITVQSNLSVTFENIPPAGVFGEMIVEVVDGSAFTLTLPTIQWVDNISGNIFTTLTDYLTGVGRSPATLQASGTDTLQFWVTDGVTIKGRLW